MLMLLAACAMHPPPPEALGWFLADPSAVPWSRGLTRAEPACGEGPVTIGIHGIFGAGPEWAETLPFLESPVWMYRWSGHEPVADAVGRLKSGLTTLEACNQPIRILAHSAGGILASHLAGELPTPAVSLQVVTVAAPLGGIGLKDPVNDLSLPLFAHMGERIDSYAPATPGITIVHMRTSSKSDPFSRPKRGHSPTALTVPGATVYDLPEELGHDASLPYVAAHMADGSWLSWTPTQAAPQADGADVTDAEASAN